PVHSAHRALPSHNPRHAVPQERPASPGHWCGALQSSGARRRSESCKRIDGAAQADAALCRRRRGRRPEVRCGVFGGQPHLCDRLRKPRRGERLHAERDRQRSDSSESAPRPAKRGACGMTKGTYSFLPWARTGLAGLIDDPDPPTPVNEPDPPEPDQRATGSLTLELDSTKLGGGVDAQQAARHIQLYGPGQVTGIGDDAVIRTDPEDWTPNFEANYLAAIDFYDEDLPWRYTPVA